MEKALSRVLGVAETVPERIFADVSHIPKDREVLIYMARQVSKIVATEFELLQKGMPIFVDEPDGRWHRYLIPRPMALLGAKDIHVVGFFGQKREQVSPDKLVDLSNRLVARIPDFPEILSYSTMALENGDFSNLVLLANEEIKLAWMEGETHNKAVDRSPGYYLSVRLNNGVLADGILEPDSLIITQVKYCDYEQDPPWKAVRLVPLRMLSKDHS